MARDRWPSRLLFIFAAVGSAAGLGNLWRFPYLAAEYGGGAFLIPYFLCLLIIGIPLLLLEFALGQYFQKSAVGSLRKLKEWGGTIGWWALGCGFIILSYYAVVMAWALRYFFASFTTAWSGDASGYFYSTVLHLTDGIGTLGGINWTIFGCLILVWLMIYFSAFKGVRSVSQVVKVTMPLPIILLIVLLFRAVTLDGAGPGLLLYMTPVFSALFNPQVWIAAAGQVFFTLTLSFGVMIAYGSYVKKEQDTPGDTIWTTILNSSISILSGFVVFGTLGFLALQQGSPVAEMVSQASGPGLAFVIFPEALSMMPMSWLFSLLFFIVLLTLGIDSAFSLVEGLNAAFKDRLTTSIHKIALLTAILCLAAGVIYTTNAGLYYLDVVDNFVLNYGLLLVGVFTCLLAGWTKGGAAVKEHLSKQSTWFPVTAWWWIIRLVAPVILVLLVLVSLINEIKTPYGGYPGWALTIGWVAVFLPLVVGWFLNRWYGHAERSLRRQS